MSRRLATVHLSLDVLEHLLRLPPGVSIIATQPGDFSTVILLLEGERFDEVPDGAQPPLVLLVGSNPPAEIIPFDPPAKRG